MEPIKMYILHIVHRRRCISRDGTMAGTAGTGGLRQLAARCPDPRRLLCHTYQTANVPKTKGTVVRVSDVRASDGDVRPNIVITHCRATLTVPGF